MLYLDLDELDHVFDGHWFWSTSRPAPARFRRSDHIGPPDEPLAMTVKAKIARHTGRAAPESVRILTHLAYFGHCFNPLSVYYAYDSGNRLQDVVLEVSNTPWGEQHCYVLSAEDNLSRRFHRFRFAKDFHVSPFLPMDMEYRCRLTEPGDGLYLSLDNYKAGKKVFGSQLALERREINSRNLAAALATDPFITLRVMTLIHWQAARLWLKRARFYDHPGNSSLPGPNDNQKPRVSAS